MPKAQGSAVLGALTDTGEQASPVTPRCGARTIIGKVSSIKKKPAFNPTQAFIATALDDCIGANLAVKCPYREWLFSSGERKSVGKVTCFCSAPIGAVRRVRELRPEAL